MRKKTTTRRKVNGAKVAPEMIEDVQEIQQVSPEKQLRKDLEPYKWQPGQSGNPSGRPKDPLKAIGLRIAQLKVGKTLKPKEQKYLQDFGLEMADLTTIEFIMAQLATSRNPAKIQMYLERTFGSVPRINLNAQISENLVQRFGSKFTDAELERIKSGEDALEILLDKLPDVDRVIDVEPEDD